MGLWVARKKSPQIWIPKHIQDRMAKKAELTNAGKCNYCNQYYSWKVQQLQQFERPNSEKEDNQTRAMALFEEYRLKGVGPCCASPEHRKFISDNVGLVIYN